MRASDTMGMRTPAIAPMRHPVLSWVVQKQYGLGMVCTAGMTVMPYPPLRSAFCVKPDD